MKALLLSVMAVSLFAGCISVNKHSFNSNHTSSRPASAPRGEEERIVVAYHHHDERAMLEGQRFTLVFEDFSKAEREIFHLQNHRAYLQVKGFGRSTLTTSCRRNLTLVEFKSDYADGTNTLAFGKHTVRFVNGGKRLLVSDADIDLSTYKCVRLNGEKVKVD